MPLVIVESPTKAKTLSKFLGNDFRIEATYGHVRDLPIKKLGIEIKETTDDEFDFVPSYEIIADRKKRIIELKKLAQNAKEIFLASDPDREGEAISFHIKEILTNESRIKNKELRIKRIVFHEITKSAIEQALKTPGEIDERLVAAQTARRFLDRLVGYKLSPVLWNKLGKRWLSAGRVQTVAVRLIVEREREIQAFKPVEFWLIDIEFKAEKDQFIARLEKINGKKAELGNKAGADDILAKLNLAKYIITGIETRDIKKSPVPPFTTSTLQQMAVNRFGWSAKKTMRAAQNLYEEGLITYHRTDSTNLASEAISSARNFIEKSFGVDYLPEAPRFYKTKSKVAQEAHEAIRPTNVMVVSPTDEKNIIGKSEYKLIPEELGRDGQLLYSLIWRRFLACQMSDAIISSTVISVDGLHDKEGVKQQYLFKTSSQKVKFDGYLKLYDKKDPSDAKAMAGGEEKNKTPNVTENEQLSIINIIPQQKFTEPPARYNEASLIKALEEKGIGRPSTYAPIMSTIQDRKYVEKIEKRLAPTDLGFAVCDFLVKNFASIFDVSFTAGMEDQLDEIANGNTNTNKVLSVFYKPFKTRIDEVFKDVDRVKVDLGTTDEKCPICGSAMVVKMSRFGKFLACTRYPECKGTKNIIEKAGIACPKCGGDVIVKKTRRGKQFYGCINYPKCDFAAWKKEDIK